MTDVSFTLSTDEARAVNGFLKLVDAQKKAEGQAKRNKKANAEAFGPKMRQSVALMAGALGSVTAALAAANRGYENQRKNLREIANETKNAANQIVSFAALQAGGTRAQRVGRASALAAGFGITDRGAAFNTVQALQSAASSANPGLSEQQAFERGMRSAGAVFAATRVGISLDSALEAEVRGQAQGARPGDFVRLSYAAGQASSRDPETLARAAQGLQFVDDKEFGFAAASILSANFGNETSTFLRRAGIALSDVSAGKEYFDRYLPADASQFERLQLLRDKGVDTPAELSQIGIKEVREVAALEQLIKNLGSVVRIQGEIGRRNRPGLLAGERLNVEAELPMLRSQRLIDTATSMRREEQVFGPAAHQAQAQELSERAAGLAFERMGVREVGPLGMFDTVDEEGRSSVSQVMLYEFMSAFSSKGGGGARKEFRAEYEQALRDIVEASRNLNQAAGAMNDSRGFNGDVE